MTAPTIPTDAAGLEETLSDEKKLAAIVDAGGLGEFVQNYAKVVAQKDKGAIRDQVKEAFDAFIVDWARENQQENIGRLNLAPGRGVQDRGAAYNADAPGAKLDDSGIFKDHKDFLRNIWHGNQSASAVANRARILNDFSSVVPSDGGFLVPESLRTTLLTTSLEGSLVRPRAMVIPMETARVSFPMLESTSTVTSLFGGMIAYWTEEAARLAKTSAKWGRVTLDAKKLTGYSVVPNELFADAMASMEAFLNQTWPQVLTWHEDLAYIRGTGAGEPLGFQRAGAIVDVAKTSGQAAATITWANIVAMYARMLPTSLGNAVWFANIDTFPQLATMTAPGGLMGALINNGTQGPPVTILGRPVIFTEKMETLGTVGDLAFVDLSYYMIGDRQTMQMATSEHVEFDTDQTAVRIIQRGDGRPWLQSAVTPNKGANTLSPFVRLATRS